MSIEDRRTPDHGVPAAPSSNPPPRVEPMAPASARVSVMIASAAYILVERRGDDDSAEYSLPSVELREGESIAAAAAALVDATVGKPPAALLFQRLAIVSATGAAPPGVRIGVYVEVAPDDSGAAPATRGQQWAFCPLGSLPSPLDADAAVALRACHERLPAIDLDGQPLAVGFGLAGAGLGTAAGPGAVAGAGLGTAAGPGAVVGAGAAVADYPLGPGRNAGEALAAGLRPPSNGRMMLTAGLSFAGVGAWVTGLLVSLRHAYRFDEEIAIAGIGLTALVMAVVSHRLAFSGNAADSPVEAVARGAGGLIAGGVFSVLALLLAVWIGEHGDERIAFWLWFWGVMLTAAAFALVRGSRQSRIDWRSRKTAALGALGVLSFAAVFPPLREGLEESFEGRGEEVRGDLRQEPEILFPDQ